MDSALLNYKNELPDSAVTAIKEAQSYGHKIYIVTGRGKADFTFKSLSMNRSPCSLRNFCECFPTNEGKRLLYNIVYHFGENCYSKVFLWLIQGK